MCARRGLFLRAATSESLPARRARWPVCSAPPFADPARRLLARAVRTEAKRATVDSSTAASTRQSLALVMTTPALPEDPTSPSLSSCSPAFGELEAIDAVFESAFAEDDDLEPEPEAEERVGLVLPSIQLGSGLGGDAAALWNFVSPCSADEEDVSSPRFFAEDADNEGGDEAVKEKEDSIAGEEWGDSSDDDDDGDGEEAVETVDADSFWAAVEQPSAGELVWSHQSDSDIDDDSDDVQDTRDTVAKLSAVASGDVGSPETLSSPRKAAGTSRSLMWRRIKARSYAGASSTAEVMKQRARTIGSMAMGGLHSQENQIEDDGDFSSDDEDCQRERSQSEMQDPRAQWRRRQSVFTSRLSVAASSLEGLKHVRGTLTHGLVLFRSSSSNTITSEDSFLGSPSGSGASTINCDIKSAPAVLHLGDEGHPRGVHVGTMPNSRNFRAGMSKAAGYLNAASAEAARKLKSRTTTLRAHKKAVASETEEESEPPPVTTSS